MDYGRFIGFGSVWLFLDLDIRSLLIQRCKNYAAFRNYFVQGAVLPDEGRFYPTNGIWARADRGRREPLGVGEGCVAKCPTFALEKVLSLFLHQTLKVPDSHRG